MNTLLIIEFSLSRKKRVNKQAPAPDQLQREENGDQIRNVQSAAWEGATSVGGAASDERTATGFDTTSALT
jgi:hypothetical protein